MAAATVTAGSALPDVFGRNRVKFYDSVVFAANGDTLTVPGMKRIRGINLVPTTNTAFGFTVSNNVITLVSGGALTFGGYVIGL